MPSVKIGIGTAQFGLDYGVSNRLPKTPSQEIEKILSFAEERSIRYLDTSPSYGESEEVLGSILPASHRFRISTKTPVSAGESVEETLYRSLDRLKQNAIYALLLHRPEHLLLPDGQRRVEALMTLKQRGLVQKIGVSVYDEAIIEKILAFFTPDMIQLPLSPFDQRLFQNGTLKKLKRLNIEVQARSIFLQGLLLMKPGELPPYFKPAQREIQNYHHFLRTRNLTPLQASVSFAEKVKEIDSFVCGVCTLEQLQEIAAATSAPLTIEELTQFSMKDEAILNPSLWPTAS